MTKTSYTPGVFNKSAVMVGSARPQPPRFVLRRRHVLRAMAAVLVLLLIYLFGYEPAYHGTLVVRAPRPLIFAHRGFGDYGPDNSLYAVERALEAGMDGVDVDGQLTRDGELVIFHDLSVDRLTSGTGRVEDKTLKEMLTLDLGPKYKTGLSGAYVRTFEHFVRSVKGRGTVMVELKVPGLAPTGIEQRAVEIIRKYDAHLSVVLSSFNPLVLYRVKQLDPLVRTAFIFMDTNSNPEPIAEIKPDDLVNPPWVLRQEFIRRAMRKFVRYDMLSINHQVDEAAIDRLIAKGWPAFIWTPDTEADIRRAIAKRPYGVISDQPILARQLRGE
jgi:glycerophosphoryl diester phosphodiesterase